MHGNKYEKNSINTKLTYKNSMYIIQINLQGPNLKNTNGRKVYSLI